MGGASSISPSHAHLMALQQSQFDALGDWLTRWYYRAFRRHVIVCDTAKTTPPRPV